MVSNSGPFSRMLRRRVFVLRLGPGAKEATKIRASIRKRSQASAGVRKFASVPECRGRAAIESPGVLVAKRRTVVDFGVVASQKCQQSQGWGGGSWSRNAELSSILASCSEGWRGGGGVVVAKRRTVHAFGLVFCRRVSIVATVTGTRGVLLAKRRTVLAFGLVSCRRGPVAFGLPHA